MKNNKKIIAGLTGGIASGKTLLGGFFGELGAHIIDADVVSREVTDSSEIKEKMLELFPSAHFDGILDRKKLRELVFNDLSEKNKLNALTHPAIAERIKRQAYDSMAEVVIVVAPLLFEVGLDKWLHPVICVSADTDERINRLIKRDTISRELAYNMISAQLSDEEREKRSHIVIRNDGDIESLKSQATSIFRAIKNGEY